MELVLGGLPLRHVIHTPCPMLRSTHRSVLFVSFALLLTVHVAMGQSWSGGGGGYGDTDGNSMGLYFGTNENGAYDQVLDKPFIIVEGFDQNNSRNADWYYSMAPSFFDKARRAGADVLILDFANALADMLENAAVVKRAVRHIGDIKTGSTQIRVAGISMGGVIARYALADGSGLDVSHYVSLDAPHQGAAIDGDLLTWIQDPPGQIGLVHALMTNVVRSYRTLLKEKAVKQMLVYNPYSNGDPDNSLCAA